MGKQIPSIGTLWKFFANSATDFRFARSQETTYRAWTCSPFGEWIAKISSRTPVARKSPLVLQQEAGPRDAEAVELRLNACTSVLTRTGYWEPLTNR